MKKLQLHTIVLLLLFSFFAKAQQTPVINEWNYDARFYNPAAFGEGFVSFFYQQRFLDLETSQAPNTYAMSLDFSDWFKLAENRIGLGVGLMSDKEHVQVTTNANLFFAYHLIRNENLKLSAGIVAGLLNKRFDFENTPVNHVNDVVIMNSDQSQRVFNGGFGIQFQSKFGERQTLNVNAVMPQLYSSDLTYDTAFLYDLQPHLLAGISYRLGFGFLDLEPAVFYRDMFFGRELKGGKLDFNLRLHFLENRFTVGGGYRMDAEDFNFSFGVQATPTLRLFGTYEAHNQLGGTFEIGGLFSFKEPENQLPKPNQGKDNFHNEKVARIAAQIENSTKEIRKYHKKANASYLKAYDHFKVLKSKNLNEWDQQRRLDAIATEMEDTYQKLEQIRSTFSNVKAWSNRAESSILSKGASEKQDKIIENMRAQKSEANELFQKLEARYENLKRDVENWEKEHDGF